MFKLLGIYSYAMRIFITKFVLEYAFDYIVKIPTLELKILKFYT